MAQSTVFGTNLPKNFANLAGVDASGTYGDIPQYMLDMLAASQAPATSAAASTSPGASAPAAAPQRYATLDWKGLAGREMIPSMKGNLQPSYQIPIEQLADFMKSGYGSNYRSSGSFNEGESNLPKVNMATFTNPLTGEVGDTLMFADKHPELGYRSVAGGNYVPSNEQGWKFRTAASQATPAPVTEEPPASVPLTPPLAQSPYVLTETPDEFKYAEGGLVEVADQLRQKGRMGDSILAHINPDEARMLKMMGGSGTINPETGLPEYFGFKDIIKVAAPIVGSVLGGPAGAALGGAIGGAAGGGGIKGALMGGLGSLASGFMANSALGGMGGGTGLGSIMNMFGGGDKISGGGSQEQLSGDVGNDTLSDSFVAQKKKPDLMGALKDPLVLGGLGLATLAGLGGGTDKRNKKLLQEQREERRAKEEQESQEFRDMIAAQTPRSINTPPPDYYTYGTRPEFNYFNNNTGGVKFASGGYVEGAGGGQDDAIQARLSNNEYVIPADIVAHLGDGAPKAGAEKLDAFLSNVRKHKAVKGHPPKAKPVQKYIGGLSGRA